MSFYDPHPFVLALEESPWPSAVALSSLTGVSPLRVLTCIATLNSFLLLLFVFKEKAIVSNKVRSLGFVLLCFLDP